MDYKEGALSSKKKEEKKKPEHSGGGHKHPHIHVHSHEAGHTMHVMHEDGSHEMHHFGPGDTAGMGEVMAAHLGGAPAGGAEPAQHLAEGASPEQEQQEQAA